MKKRYRVSWTALRRMGTSLRISGPGTKEIVEISAERAEAEVLVALRKSYGPTVLAENIATEEVR